MTPKLTTLVVVALLLAGCSSDEVNGAQQGGPARVPVPSNSMNEFPVGTAHSDAYSRVHLTGDTPGVLDGVELIGGDGYTRKSWLPC